MLESGRVSLDIDLPIADEPVPTLPKLSAESVCLLLEQIWADTNYDEEFFARSLASKNDVPFVM